MARAEAVALPRRVRLPQADVRERLLRVVPSRRSLAIGLGLLALAAGAYLLARETSLFAIERIDVRGGSPQVAAQIRRTLASLAGTTLVGLDGAAVVRRVDALPTVVRASYDRAFPHTLRISVVPERPAAVLRRGPDSWLVSERGRVIERLKARADGRLPRIWVAGRTPVQVGGRLGPGEAGAAARAVGLAGAFATRVASAAFVNGSLVFHLRSGIQLLLGSGGDIKLKVAVARRALAVLPSGSTFLDLSVNGRAVAGTGAPTVVVRARQGSSRG